MSLEASAAFEARHCRAPQAEGRYAKGQNPPPLVLEQIHPILSDRDRLWSDHVRSWCETSAFPVLEIRYETLMAEPDASPAKICKLLQLPVTAGRIRRAVAHSRFDVLAADERASGFSERSPHSRAFFREGAVGKGK